MKTAVNVLRSGELSALFVTEIPNFLAVFCPVYDKFTVAVPLSVVAALVEQVPFFACISHKSGIPHAHLIPPAEKALVVARDKPLADLRSLGKGWKREDPADIFAEPVNQGSSRNPQKIGTFCGKPIAAVVICDAALHHLTLIVKVAFKVGETQKMTVSAVGAVEKCEHTQRHDCVVEGGILELNEGVEAFLPENQPSKRLAGLDEQPCVGGEEAEPAVGLYQFKARNRS